MRTYLNLLLLILISTALQNCEKEKFTETPNQQNTQVREIDENETNQVIVRYERDYTEDVKEILRYKYSNSINFTINSIEYSEWDSRLELWMVTDNESTSDIDLNDLITNMKTKEFEEGDLEESPNSIISSSVNNEFFIPGNNSSMSYHLTMGDGPIIAIIDSGLDYGQLPGRYLYQTSRSGSQAISGWDFINNDRDVRDDYGHGTHIAKIIKEELSQHNINPNFVPLKAFDELGQTNMFQLLKALSYVNAHEEIDILNMSLGFFASSDYKILEEIIEEISENTLIICSAGNDGVLTDQISNMHFPSGLPTKNLLSVGGYIAKKGGPEVSNNKVYNIESATLSNYGVETVDFYAPFDGYELIYPSMSAPVTLEGTSYSAAFATARAAFLKETNAAQTTLREDLLDSGYLSQSLMDKCQYSSAILRNEIND